VCGYYKKKERKEKKTTGDSADVAEIFVSSFHFWKFLFRRFWLAPL